MRQVVEPLFVGPRVTFRQLEAAFGPSPGMVLGYGEGEELGADGKQRWTAAVLPSDAMARLINKRHAAGLHGPFLIGMGSFKRAISLGGVGEAVYGVSLVADGSLAAEDLLHPDYLAERRNQNERGEFKWRTGVPFLRTWLCFPPLSFLNLTGVQPNFGQAHGIRVVPFDEVVAGLATAILDVGFREVVLDRPKPLPEVLTRSLRVNEGALRRRTICEKVRDRSVADEALAINRLRFGNYTCEECAYQPASDGRVPKGYGRSILDVHHLDPLKNGIRETTAMDLAVICPLCHRRLHVAERAAAKARTVPMATGPLQSVQRGVASGQAASETIATK